MVSKTLIWVAVMGPPLLGEEKKKEIKGPMYPRFYGTLSIWLS
jgi:hypothetical protein